MKLVGLVSHRGTAILSLTFSLVLILASCARAGDVSTSSTSGSSTTTSASTTSRATVLATTTSATISATQTSTTTTSQATTSSAIPTTTTTAAPSTTPPPSAALSVQSADRAVTIDIPAGALPSGTDPKTIKVTKMAAADGSITVNGQPVPAAFRLEPDGMQFTAPATVRATIPYTGTAIPTAFLLSSKGFDALAKPQVAFDRAHGTVTITGQVGHFCYLGINTNPLVSVDIAPVGDHYQGVPFTVSARITMTSNTLLVDYFDAAGTKKEYSVTIKPLNGVNFTVTSGSFSDVTKSAFDSGKVAPFYVKAPDASTPVAGNSLLVGATFTGSAPGNVDLEYTGGLDFNEVVDGPFGTDILDKESTWTSFTGGTSFKILRKPWTSGAFKLNTSVLADPGGHFICTQMGSIIMANVSVVGDPVLTVTGAGNWITVTGEIKLDGSFTATGRGTVVAGPTVTVVFKGTWTDYGGFSGTYTYGAGGELPGGQSITYNVTAARQ